MLSLIIEKISSEDSNVSTSFVEARKFWNNFFDQNAAKSEADLSKCLGDAQSNFTSLFPREEYYFAKVMMALTAIASIHDKVSNEGFLKDVDGNFFHPTEVKLAKKTLRAFAYSSVSEEVKSQLNAIAEAYGLKKSKKYESQLAHS